MAFERAWMIVKDVDFKIPSPSDKPPSYLDRDANLAFHGSQLPHWFAHENPWGPDELSEDDFVQSIKDEMRRRKGELVMAPYMDYKVGDFGDALEDFEGGGFLTPHHDKEAVLGELERASLVRALMGAGIVDRREMSDAIDEADNAMSRGWYSPGHTQVSGPPPERSDWDDTPQKRAWLTTQLGRDGMEEY